RARQETKETFRSVWNFDYLALLPAGSVARCKIAFIRAGAIGGFEEYEVEKLAELLPLDLDRVYSGPLAEGQREWQYDEFCLVCNFILDPLQSVDLIEVSRSEGFAVTVQKRVQERRKKILKSDESCTSDPKSETSN